MGNEGNSWKEEKRDGSGMGAIFLTIFIDLIGFSIVFPLLPALLAHYLPLEGADSLVGRAHAFLLNISPASDSGANGVLALVLFGGVVGSLYSVLQFISSPIWGRLSDRFGRRNILLITTSFTCLGYLVWIFSGSFWLFVLARLINGMMAGNLSVATAAVADVTSKNARTRGMAIIGVSFALGFMIGPAIGGAATMLDLTKLWPEMIRYGINPFSFPAFVSFSLAALNFVCVMFFFKETLLVENRTRHTISFNPLSNLMLDNSIAKRIVFVNFAFLVVFSGMEFTLTFLAMERLNYGPVQNIAIFVFGGVVMTLVQGIFTHRSATKAKFGMTNMVAFGIVLGFTGMLILALSGNATFFFIGLFFKACGIALLSPTITALVSLYTPPNKQGAVMGTFRATGSLARAIGPLFAAVMYWSMGSMLTYISGSIILIIPLCLALRLPDPRNCGE